MGLFDFFKKRSKAEQQPQEPTSTTAESEAEVLASSEQASASDTNSITTSTSMSTSSQSQESSDTVTEPTSTTEKMTVVASTSSSLSQSTSLVESAQSLTNASVATDETDQTRSTTEAQASAPESESLDHSLDEDSSTSTANHDATVNSESETSATQTDEARYDKGLEKSRHTFGERLNHLLANFRSVDEDFFDELEETLIGADVGYDMAMQISDQLREEVKLQNVKKSKDVKNVVVQKLIELYDAAGADEHTGLKMAEQGPTVILFVGVNGVGKTTTIGKMANRFKQDGQKVLLAAADTFRAGAIQQLNVWAERDGVDIVKKPEQSDPSAVVFDALKKAKAENYDILFVDTAGRLQNKANLMNELAKMKRVITREVPDAPHEVLLVLDATTGQNALNQAKLFKDTTDVSGIVLTKLDGTARGGIVLAIRNELHLPVKYVGLGEQVDDLRPFVPSEFIYGLFKGLIDVD